MFRLFASKSVYVLIGVFAVVPIVYFFLRITNQPFLDSAMGDWFATMIGAVVGIPIALWLSRWQQGEQERKKTEALDRQSDERRTRIVGLIAEELAYNRHQLLHSQVEQNGTTKRVVILNGLKDELWRALSDGGELQWLNDLSLLQAFAEAYHHIRRVIAVERLWMQAKRPPTYQDEPAKLYEIWLEQLDPLALRFIDRALEIAGLEACSREGGHP